MYFVKEFALYPAGSNYEAKIGFKASVSVVCCYRTNHPKLRGLQQQTLVVSHSFRGSEIWDRSDSGSHEGVNWGLEGLLPRRVPHMVTSRRPGSRLPLEHVIGLDDCLYVVGVAGEKN